MGNDGSGVKFVTERSCEEVSRRIFAKLDSIERRLFRDNGTLSIQTRLDRHEQVIRVILWALSVIGGAFLTSIVVSGVFVIKALLKAG
jgi:hypothetical protein